MTILKVTVAGKPTPQGSKRTFYLARSKRTVTVDSNRDKLANYRADIVEACRRWLGEDNPTPCSERPVSVHVAFTFKRPKSHYRTGRNSKLLRVQAPEFHTQTPDVDKVARAVLDALVAAAVIADDSQVTILVACKRWGRSDETCIEVNAL